MGDIVPITRKQRVYVRMGWDAELESIVVQRDTNALFVTPLTITQRDIAPVQAEEIFSGLVAMGDIPITVKGLHD